MNNLSVDQINHLNMYSVYVEEPPIPLFQLRDFMTNNTADYLNAVKVISQSPNDVVAASYFMRRWGMFISMQFYLITSSNLIWDGEDRVHFGAVEEYGLRTVGTFVKKEDFRIVTENEREGVIRKILEVQCNDVIAQIRQTCSVSPLTLWENIFGYLIWHYHVFFSSPDLSIQAKKDWELLSNDDIWIGIAKSSRFKLYTGGKEPSSLLNVPVRKSCCFSKDVPGLMRCTFCPISE